MATGNIQLAIEGGVALGPHVSVLYDWLMQPTSSRSPFSDMLEDGLLDGIKCQTNMDEFLFVDTNSLEFDRRIAYMEVRCFRMYLFFSIQAQMSNF